MAKKQVNLGQMKLTLECLGNSLDFDMYFNQQLFSGRTEIVKQEDGSIESIMFNIEFCQVHAKYFINTTNCEMFFGFAVSMNGSNLQR